MLYRVVQEALANVAKHAGRGVRVTVRLAWAAGGVEVSVVDSGGDGTEVGLPSGGFGLTSMAERAALKGGRLRAGSLGRRFRGPAVAAGGRPPRSRRHEHGRGAGPAYAGAEPVRVLVADDQKVVRDGLSLLLGMLPGVEVIGTAVDGTDAVRQAAAAVPDVVLMDLSMPNCDGVEATRQIAAPAARMSGSWC